MVPYKVLGFLLTRNTQKTRGPNVSKGCVHMGIKEGVVKIFELYNCYAGFHLYELLMSHKNVCYVI